MNKSLFKKIFIPIVLIGIIIVLIVSLVSTPNDFLNSFILGVIIWIPVWAVVTMGITILDAKKKMNLDAKISTTISNLKTKCKSPQKFNFKSAENKAGKDISSEVSNAENDSLDVKIEEVELGVYNIDFGDIMTPIVKINNPISSVVIFENESVKNDFKAFCDNGFKPLDKIVKSTPPALNESKFFIGEKPSYVIKKAEGAPLSTNSVVNSEKSIPDKPQKNITELSTSSIPTPNPVTTKKSITQNIQKLDGKLNFDVPIKPIKKDEIAESNQELPDLVFIPDAESLKNPQTKVQTEIPPVEKSQVVIPKPIQNKTEETVKKSPFKIPAFKFNPKSKTIEKNEEAIFNPVVMKPKELGVIDKPSKLIITDERLVKIVKYPETMTPAELNLIKSNQDLKKRYYEFMTALYDEND